MSLIRAYPSSKGRLEKKPFREIRQDGIHHNLHPAQSLAMVSDKRFIFLLSGTQVGKTIFAPVWLEREMGKCGDGDYLVVTSTFPLLENKLLPVFKEYFIDIRKYGKYNEFKKILQFDNSNIRIIFGSATNPESLEAATAKAAVLDEVGQAQFRHETWQAVLRRLSLAQGRVLGLTTLYNWGWLKSEIYDKCVAGDPTIDVIQADSTVNPFFPIDEYERAQQSLPRWKFDLFYRGVYSRPAGMVYDSFDETMCKIPRFAIPKEWTRFVGHDFGGVNTVALWYALDPSTGYFYLYRTYKQGGRTAKSHAEAWKHLSEGELIVKRVGGAKSEDQWRNEFSQQGWVVQEPKVSAPQVQIDRVYALNAANKVYVFNDLTEYLDEKVSYSYELDDNYNPTGKIENEPTYHYMAAERYLLSDFTPELAYSGVPRQARYGTQGIKTGVHPWISRKRRN